MKRIITAPVCLLRRLVRLTALVALFLALLVVLDLLLLPEDAPRA
jgi:hypothetical protein